MSPRIAAETAFAVAGVFLLAGSVSQAVLSIDMGLHAQNPDALVRWIGAIGACLHAVIGAALIASRHWLSMRLAPESQDQVETGTDGIHAAAISVVGVYFLAAGLSGLLREVLRSVVPHSVFGAALSLYNCAGPIAETVVGFALFLGSRGIISLWRGLRSAGRHADP
jgi:hypothetical protein